MKLRVIKTITIPVGTIFEGAPEVLLPTVAAIATTLGIVNEANPRGWLAEYVEKVDDPLVPDRA